MAMGYGHLRAAHALADELGVDVLHADQPPLAAGEEIRLWEAARRLYEWASRISQWPLVGKPFEKILEAVTAIPHFRPGDGGSAASCATRRGGAVVPLLSARMAPAESRPDGCC